MKKITLLLITFLAFTLGNAQTTCSTAIPVSAGTTTVPTLTGSEIPDPICAENGAGASVSEWYSYTATVNGVANVTTNIAANTGGDTRVHVYSGTCAALECVGGNDDADVASMNYLSDLTFPVSSGVTYLIAWDDRWDDGGFDFVLTETAVTCPDGSVPIDEEFDDANQFVTCYVTEDVDGNDLSWIQQELDVDGDSTLEYFATNAANTAFGALPKDDWLFSPAITLVDGATYNFTFKFNGANAEGGTASEDFEIVLIDTADSGGTVLTTLTTQTDVVQSGTFAEVEMMATEVPASYVSNVDGSYYIGVHVTTPAPSGFLLLFNYTVQATLSVDDFAANNFNHSYNKDTDVLKLESSLLPLENISLYNILGQNVINKTLSQNNELVDLSSLKDGVYLAKITMEGKTQTVKILKQ
nr:T9SS type A sorting domain-containing protein [uncultured Psychroserpens sp.]